MKFHRILKHAPNCAGRTRCEKGNDASDVATLSGARRRRGVGSTKSVSRATRFTRKTSSPAERKVWLPVYCFYLTVMVSSQLAPSTSQQSGNHWSQFHGDGWGWGWGWGHPRALQACFVFYIYFDQATVVQEDLSFLTETSWGGDSIQRWTWNMKSEQIFSLMSAMWLMHT